MALDVLVFLQSSFFCLEFWDLELFAFQLDITTSGSDLLREFQLTLILILNLQFQSWFITSSGEISTL